MLNAGHAGPLPGYRSRGAKNHKGGTFLKYNIGCMQQPGPKHEIGGHRFSMGGRNTTATPLATALGPLKRCGGPHVNRYLPTLD